MSRGVHSDVITELAKDSFQMAHLVKIDFETPVYLTESPISITYSSNAYLPSSHLRNISSVSETSEVQVGTINITLSGVSQEYVAILLGQKYIDRQVTVNRVVLNDSHGIIGNPILIYDGRIEGFTISDSNITSTIVIKVASHWADFEKKSGRRTNHNSQQIHFSGDKGFEFAPDSIRDIKWGRA